MGRAATRRPAVHRGSSRPERIVAPADRTSHRPGGISGHSQSLEEKPFGPYPFPSSRSPFSSTTSFQSELLRHRRYAVNSRWSRQVFRMLAGWKGGKLGGSEARTPEPC